MKSYTSPNLPPRRHFVLWSTAALTLLTLTLAPFSSSASAATTVSGITSPVQSTAPVRNTTIPPISSAAQTEALPNVLVIGTGGTIAGQSTDETSFLDYKAGSLPIADMVGSLPNMNKVADVNTLQFGNSGSSAYSMGDLYDLSLSVDKALETYDSVVVTTGTDTMEEIAYFLDLTVQSDKPVIITGSMRPWTVIGSDAKANLFNAIKLAASERTTSFGTVLMLNDTIHLARGVTKTNDYRTDTFETPMLGAVGYIDGDHIRIYRAPARATESEGTLKPVFDLSKISKQKLEGTKVEIAISYQEAGSGAIKGFVADGATGIVTSGTGAGGISRAMSSERNEAIKDGVVFVTTTRTGSGSVYSEGEGVISGDNLSAQQARILLLLSLSFSDDFDTMKEWFSTYGKPEV
ncbi:asparaginase [Paenibacillus sp. Marseille-Q4541]|uniref:asparaginase n=1 Tax=Paenibacillus sp. Marseille-Q4541 TaxID=2831522 RepID=UPI001BAA8BD8|nr:asparaginase [Paenibacillus sp. Marseille-Q4541]